MERYLQKWIADDALAQKKMAFITGPRQCGKTTLAQHLLDDVGQGRHYFSWDDDEFRKNWIRSPKSILNELVPAPGRIPRLVIDELHKYSRWKNSLKGLYDLNKNRIQLIVTGSARLDFYRRSGDSLAGRYLPYRLHPFSLGEVARVKRAPKEDFFEDCTQTFSLKDLLALSGFPEALLRGSEELAQRWSRLHREMIIREDLRDLKSVRDIVLVDTLAVLLAQKAASQFSYNSLKEDLRVAFATVQDWVGLLESVYYCFLIRPYTSRVARSIQKEPKVYLMDWTRVTDLGRRLENLVACHLLKACHAWTDSAQGHYELFYVRDKEKREVDFLVTENRKPYLLAEVKSGDSNISPALFYYTAKLKPKFSFQIVMSPSNEASRGLTQIEVVSAERFLSALP